MSAVHVYVCTIPFHVMSDWRMVTAHWDKVTFELFASLVAGRLSLPDFVGNVLSGGRAFDSEILCARKTDRMADESEGPWIAATRSGPPSCPACQNPHQIEPLLQVEGTWYMRCLHCGYGFMIAPRLAASAPERRRNEERRAVARSGRRATDLRQPVICTHCGGQDVHGWVRTGETLWARCRTCGRVQRVDDDR